MQTYLTEEARKLVADAGLIARVSANGATLVVYEGDEERPGSWSEVDRFAIRNGAVAAPAIRNLVSP